MGQAITVVDAFTDTPFSGNPAAVCVLARPTTEAWMRAVAAEMNLSETAFLVPRDDGDHDLRWFTPTDEVDLCGHATLASAHVLGGSRRFHTRSGVLTGAAGEGGTVVLDLPATRVAPVADPPDWAPALGLPPGGIVGVWSGDGGWVLAEAATPADVRGLVPDMGAIEALGGYVLVVAAPGDRPGLDSVCRLFAPDVGIPEDPVTGAAHCVIAPWLAERTGRTEFAGEQASARGGRVGMRVGGERVFLTGHAVTVWEGALRADPPAA
ncbi:MAG TPA: PhzF family phenazine biosynthesis protein [Acidimicrobiales bacterium]|nr:PhzF family phenazine biosynthesis protein [Acidimicrobiales bacterium]